MEGVLVKIDFRDPVLKGNAAKPLARALDRFNRVLVRIEGYDQDYHAVGDYDVEVNGIGSCSAPNAAQNRLARRIERLQDTLSRVLGDQVLLAAEMFGEGDDPKVMDRLLLTWTRDSYRPVDDVIERLIRKAKADCARESLLPRPSDGPRLPDQFCFHGRCVTLEATPWNLLNTIWNAANERMTKREVIEKVWPHRIDNWKDSTLASAISKANSGLAQAGYGKTLSIKSPCVVLR